MSDKEMTKQEEIEKAEVLRQLSVIKRQLKAHKKNDIIRMYIDLSVGYAQLQQVAQMLDSQVKELSEKKEPTKEEDTQNG
jgi:hypothetical protein